MRYSIACVAPLVAAAYAQSSASPIVVPVISGSVTISSTYTYSNFLTGFLTLTNSNGVVTAQPSGPAGTIVTTQPQVVTTQPNVVTSQPAVATIPAGLPTGLNTIVMANGTTAVSFVVSVASSTTVVLGTTTTSPTTSVSSTGTKGPGASGGSNGQTSTSTAHNAAPTAVKLASGAVLGLGAVFAALM